jgi:hypothetical protein
VSQSLSQKVEQYIEGQEEHHRRFDFQTEVRKLLDAHGVAYDDTCGIEAAGRNPFRVDEAIPTFAQGSRQERRQPWAMLRNAFGVPRRPWSARHQVKLTRRSGWPKEPRGAGPLRTCQARSGRFRSVRPSTESPFEARVPSSLSEIRWRHGNGMTRTSG